MKKWIFIVTNILILSSDLKIHAQSFFLALNFPKKIDSLFYKSKTLWICPAPLVFTTQKFSIDSGKTYIKAGVLGENLSPYIKGNLKAKKELRTYKILKIVGAIQLFVLAPLFIKMEADWMNEYNAKYSPPYPDIKSPGYVFYGIGFMYTGVITQAIAKKHFRRALKNKYYTF